MGKRIIVVTSASNAVLKVFDDGDIFHVIRKPFDVDGLLTSVNRA